MTVAPITPERLLDFNKTATHPLQSYEWGEFREETGIKVIRRGFFDGNKLKEGFQLTIHRIPHTPWNIGYLPKGNVPTEEVLGELQRIGKEEECVFIQLEPNILRDDILRPKAEGSIEGILRFAQNDKGKLVSAAHPLFTKYTMILDLTQSEDQLLENMHQKTRYNIRLAQKHDVKVEENNSDEAFEEYLRLTRETTARQQFYAHTEKYHRLMWQTLRSQSAKRPASPAGRSALSDDKLSAHLLTATYKNKTLVAWIVFVFKGTLYYPYGASSTEHREVMASSLMMWEAIRFGKKVGLKRFDMWGALGPEPDANDPWYGFHRFKAGFGPEIVEFVGSYDLVINPILYEGYKIADKLRWLYLRLRK